MPGRQEVGGTGGIIGMMEFRVKKTTGARSHMTSRL